MGISMHIFSKAVGMYKEHGPNLLYTSLSFMLQMHICANAKRSAYPNCDVRLQQQQCGQSAHRVRHSHGLHLMPVSEVKKHSVSCPSAAGLSIYTGSVTAIATCTSCLVVCSVHTVFLLAKSRLTP